MSASPWAYLFGILIALPVYILVGVLLVLGVKLFIQWLFDDGSATKPAPKEKGQPGATLKG
ncbi:MAG: hypothetical protein ACOY94_02210 [Bacillota bacterium]